MSIPSLEMVGKIISAVKVEKPEILIDKFLR
jgi:hypothetical protein